tara:strand:+ start:181 stop:684 length:504 start_codon:yes stop_codon:yes gene_type:complete
MTIKTESWKEQLEKVRAYGTFTEHKEESVEKSADDILNQEIEEELKLFESEEEITEKSMSSGDMIKKLFKLKNDKEVMGVANLMNMTDVKVLQKMQRDNPKGFARMAAHMGKLPAMEEVQEEKLSIEKTVSKLTEKNMLGRLAKQLQLNETGKEQLFNYFEKGELKQ